jgi:hypothetical protein
VNIQNVHFQKAEYENALIQLNEGLDVFAAVMTMSRLEKSNVFSFVANVFSFVVLLIFVICAVSLPSRCGQVRTLLAVVRSVHGNVDLLTFAKELPCYVCLITLPVE